VALTKCAESFYDIDCRTSIFSDRHARETTARWERYDQQFYTLSMLFENAVLEFM
jgi:hypothetical protein